MDYSKSSGLYYSQPRDMGTRATTIDTMQVEVRNILICRIGNCKDCDQRIVYCNRE